MNRSLSRRRLGSSHKGQVLASRTGRPWVTPPPPSVARPWPHSINAGRQLSRRVEKPLSPGKQLRNYWRWDLFGRNPDVWSGQEPLCPPSFSVVPCWTWAHRSSCHWLCGCRLFGFTPWWEFASRISAPPLNLHADSGQNGGSTSRNVHIPSASEHWNVYVNAHLGKVIQSSHRNTIVLLVMYDTFGLPYFESFYDCFWASKTKRMFMLILRRRRWQ